LLAFIKHNSDFSITHTPYSHSHQVPVMMM